jgi:hypothetical protein
MASSMVFGQTIERLPSRSLPKPKTSEAACEKSFSNDASRSLPRVTAFIATPTFGRP